MTRIMPFELPSRMSSEGGRERGKRGGGGERESDKEECWKRK